MFKTAVFSFAIASFFSLLGKESKIGPSVWWLVSFGLFWIALFLGDSLELPGTLVAVGAEVALFLAVTVIWIITPRRSSADILASIQKSKNQREEQQLMKRE